MCIKKTIKPLIIFIGLVVIIGSIVLLVVLGFKTKSYGFHNTEDCWNLWYYVFSIIGSVATLSAVIVALFKDEILQRFHAPDLRLEKYSGDIIPLVRVDGNSGGRDNYYKCELKINNIGSDNARDCSIVLSRLLYDTTRMGGNTKSEWDPRLIERVTSIGEKNNQIVSGLDTRVELFRINNPSLSSTPSGGKENKAYIVFPQTKLTDEIAAESNFEIDYEIRANNSPSIKFRVSIEWTGRWNDSISEMANNIKIKVL